MCLICYQSFSQNRELKKQVDLIHKNKYPHNCRIVTKVFHISVTKNMFEKLMRLEQPQKSIKAQVAIRVVLKK